MKLCLQRGFGSFDVELDSLVLVHILNRKAGCPWSVYKEVQQLFEIGSHFRQVEIGRGW